MTDPRRVLVVPSEIGDVYRLAATMRANDRLEATGMGGDPKEMLRASYRNSILRKTMFVDGEIAAMWGLAGVMLSDEGAPWLVTSKAVERAPVSFVKIGHAHLAEMIALRRRLTNVVLASYTSAVRFLQVLGFHLDDAQPMGPQGVLFRKFWMNA